MTSSSRPTTEQLADIQAMLGDAYVIDRLSSSDASGSAYFATERKGQRPVLITILGPEISRGVNADRFRHELKAVRSFSHDRIPAMVDAGAADGFAYYVHATTGGESLRARLTREFRLKVADVASLLVSLSDTVSAAHAKGVVHGDLRPEHIICIGDACAITGFGIAPALARSRSESVDPHVGRVGGYLAPEQLRPDGSADHLTDVYGLGILAYEMLAGERPYTSDAAARATGPLVAEPPRLAAVRRDIPRPLSDVVAKAMARDPRRRWESPAHFRAALVKAMRSPSRRLMEYAAMAVAVLLIGGAAVGYFRFRAHQGLDDRLVAVAPIEVADPSHRDWGPPLSRAVEENLNGAGDLRAVPETVSVAKWMGRTDHEGAAEFGRSVGARLAVYGRLLPANGDSVRVAASVVDVMTRDAIGDEIEIQQSIRKLDQLADSLAIQVLREIAKKHPIGKLQLRSQSKASR